MINKIKRTHDEFYVNEKRHREPKEMFKFIIEEFSSKELNQNLDICDAGCANDEFLYYLDTKSNFNLHGIDILPQLIKKAKEFVPNVKYKQGDI